jgi:ankyrin repeat protein
VLRALLAASKKLKDSIQLPQILDLKQGVNPTDEQLLDFLRIQDRKLKTALWEDEKLHQFSGLAFEIALSFFLGHGTSVNEEAGIAWLSLAAGAGEGLSTYLFGPLEQSIANAAPHIALPRRLWSCHATLAGYMHSTACLKDSDPQLHDIAIKMHRRRYWGRDEPQIVRIEPYLPNFVQLIKDNLSLVDSEAPSRRGYTSIKETALHLCAATGDMESTRYLILEAKANIDTTNERNETPIFYATRAGQFEIAKFLLEQGANLSHVSTEGIAIAHCLVMMDDHHAAELAPLYVNRGASLNVIAKEEPGVWKDNFTLGVGIPLFWAALKCQPLLFAALLQLHSRPGSKISMPDFYQLVSELAALNMHGMLKLALDSEISIVDAKLKGSVPGRGEIEELLSKMELESRKTDPNQHGSGYLSNIHYSALLYTAMDSRPRQLLKRRYTHRTGFRTAKRETIALLLEIGADPVSTHVSNEPDANPEHDIPLTLSVYTGDSIAFSLFIDWMRSQQIEILPLLEDSQRYSGYNALQRSIYTDSKEIFLLLLDLYPSLLNGVGTHGRRPLHSAAVMEWPGYVKELLRRGADRHDRANDGSTPFARALMRNKNIEIADILAEGADMERILGPDPKSGFTAFGELLSGLTAYKMDFGLDRLRYLVRKFGKPSLFANSNSPDRTTVFRSLLALRPLPTDNAQISLQSAILKFLLEVFPAEINYRDDTGRAALHYAVMFGNLAAVEILLEEGADVSLEIGPMSGDHPLYLAKTPIQGYTSLAMAVTTKERGPKDEVLRGGQREIEAWERNMQQIIDTLVRHGAGEPGSGVNLFDSVSTGIATGTMTRVYVGSSKFNAITLVFKCITNLV